MLPRFVQRLSAGGRSAASINHLHALEADLPSARSRFAIPYVFAGAGEFRSIRPRLRGDEAESLYNEALALRPRRVLQIGTRSGGCLYWWTQAATEDAILVSVGLPDDAPADGDQHPLFPLIDAFRRGAQQVRLFSDAATVAEVRDACHDEPIDLMFLDGQATPAAVATDFNRFAPLVRPDGLIAFHGIAASHPGFGSAIADLWPQLRQRYETREYVAQGSAHGVGVMVVPDADLEPIDLA
ncbi:MAG: class I SAM-dependent methyltransferase [Planctomycetota bacterium]